MTLSFVYLLQRGNKLNTWCNNSHCGVTAVTTCITAINGFMDWSLEQLVTVTLCNATCKTIYYSGFRRKARVIKCNRFPRQKGGHGPRRSMRRLRKLGTRDTTLLACDKVLGSIAPYMFISHTKMSIFFRKGRSSNYILQSQPGKFMLETFSWDNNWADRMWLLSSAVILEVRTLQ